MKMMPRFCVSLCVLCLCLPAAVAQGLELPDITHPVTYSTPSPNEEYLFVMLAPPNDDPAQNPDANEHAQMLRQKYRESGLYRNDGSTEPLWTVAGYAYGVYPANDGIHVVREDSPARMLSSFIAKRLPDDKIQAQLDSPALTFLASGKELKTYTMRQLVVRPEELPNSVAHVLWNAGAMITKDGKRFVLLTQDSQQIIFDLSTGEIVSRKEAGLGNVQIWVVRGLMAFIILFMLAAFARWLYFARKGTANL